MRKYLGMVKRKLESRYLAMDSTERSRYKSMADNVFNRDKDTLTGDLCYS
jgi:hypothetical protein